MSHPKVMKYIVKSQFDTCFLNGAEKIILTISNIDVLTPIQSVCQIFAPVAKCSISYSNGLIKKFIFT